VADLAKRVWSALTAVWSFLVNAASLVFGAWDWMVNGVLWLAEQAGRFAFDVGNTLWHLATHVIPHAIWWGIEHVTKWALHELGKVWAWIEHHVEAIYRWASHEIGQLWAWIEHQVRGLWRDVTNAWHWIEHAGEVAWHYISHPLALAELLAAHIVVPVVRWLLSGGRDVVVWLLRTFASETGAIAHLLEDVLSDVL
jgi:hypothetical protein